MIYKKENRLIEDQTANQTHADSNTYFTMREAGVRHGL